MTQGLLSFWGHGCQASHHADQADQEPQCKAPWPLDIFIFNRVLCGPFEDEGGRESVWERLKWLSSHVPRGRFSPSISKLEDLQEQLGPPVALESSSRFVPGENTGYLRRVPCYERCNFPASNSVPDKDSGSFLVCFPDHKGPSFLVLSRF